MAQWVDGLYFWGKLQCFIAHFTAKKISAQSCKMFDVHESVHRDTIMKVTNKVQLYRLIYYF